MPELPVPPAIAKFAPDGNLTPLQKRRVFIDMALRRVRPGTGSSHEFMRRRTAMHEWPDLREILQGIDWVIIGGVATRAYMPERATKDMDILVNHTDGDEVIDRLQKAGFKVISQLAIPGFLLVAPNQVELDVLFGRYPWLTEALAKPEFDLAGYPVISLPYLVLLKLKASRPQDIADLSRMLGWAEPETLNSVRQVIARHSPDDMTDLESLIFLGQQERNSPNRG